MNQATFHSTFPIFFITKIFRYDKIKNPAFLSCSGINSTRNEDGGKEISFWNVALFKKVGRHFCPVSIWIWGCNSYHFSYLFVCRPYLGIYLLIRTMIIAWKRWYSRSTLCKLYRKLLYGYKRKFFKLTNHKSLWQRAIIQRV